jgi:hypothetical protein
VGYPTEEPLKVAWLDIHVLDSEAIKRYHRLDQSAVSVFTDGTVLAFRQD